MGKFADAAIAGEVDESVDAASQHLMGEILVRDVEDDAVDRSVENIVEGNHGLDVAEVGADVTADGGAASEHGLTHFDGY